MSPQMKPSNSVLMAQKSKLRFKVPQAHRALQQTQRSLNVTHSYNPFLIYSTCTYTRLHPTLKRRSVLTAKHGAKFCSLALCNKVGPTLLQSVSLLRYWRRHVRYICVPTTFVERTPPSIYLTVFTILRNYLFDVDQYTILICVLYFSNTHLAGSRSVPDLSTSSTI